MATKRKLKPRIVVRSPYPAWPMVSDELARDSGAGQDYVLLRIERLLVQIRDALTVDRRRSRRAA